MKDIPDFAARVARSIPWKRRLAYNPKKYKILLNRVILGTTPFNAELWVERDEDFGPAHELYRTWCMPAIQTDSSWTCHVCGQSVEAQFDSCWKCATPRPELALGEFPASCDEAIHRAEEMTSLLDGILHQSDRCRLGQASLPRNSF
ncbi:MAG: hypothetical protein IT579_23650 [Verrucomicrobia subdivision 3 bacterium]|nr:hypothetical protein [Verrucomicrobiota bacterium]MCC6823729.1 hypothetical protein [Limisphaerales bacterium]